MKLEMELKGNERTFCDICGSDSNETLEIKRENPRVLLPGCEGSLILNEHLRAYFITTKLFKLSNAQFLETHFLPSTTPSQFVKARVRQSRHKIKKTDDTAERYYGGRLLYGNICAKCEGIVDEALEVHGKVVELQMKIDKLGETLFEWKEIGDKTREQDHLKDSLSQDSSNKQQETEQKMLDLSLACLSGLSTKRNEKKTHKKTSLKLARPRRPGSVQSIDIISLKSSPGPPKVEDIIDYDDDNEDDLENDELYIPSTSTDEESDFHDVDVSDEDYTPDDADKKHVAISGGENSENSKTSIAEDGDATCDNDDFEKGASNELNDFPNSGTTTFEFQCPECLRVFPKRQTLHKHTKTMHGFDMYYSCPRCPDLKFLKKRFLTEHRDKVHGGECDLCGKILTNSKSLLQHYKFAHKIKYPCPLCNMKFKGRLALRRHRINTHVLSQEEMAKLPERAPKTEEEKEWANNPCTECGKVFISADKFDAHLKKRHEYKLTSEQRVKSRRKCYFCWKIFCLEQRHWIHCKTMHPELKVEFPCDDCTADAKGSTFQSVPDLLAHFETDHPNSLVHTCLQCQRPFLDKKSLKSHVKIHVNKKPVIPEAEKDAKFPFKCWFCWELFLTEEARQRHLTANKRHWKLKVEFPCDDHTCKYNQKAFASLADLKTHSSSAHSGQDLFTCERCSWGFLSKDMLTIHKLNHVPRIKEQFTCPTCNHMTGQLSRLKDHYNLDHGLNLMLYKCSYCDKRFAHKRACSSHQSQTHEKPTKEMKEAGLPCHKCGKQFLNENRLKHHLHNSHNDFRCSTCGLEFETLSKYNYHKRMVHSVGVQHLCAACGKVCLSKILLAKHMRMHSSGYKRFECHFCGRKMSTLVDLKTHIKKIHEDRKPTGPPPKFVCPFTQCGKFYARKDTLDDHVRVNHTQDTYRIWTCNLCNKRFKRAGHLEDHLKSSKGCHKSVTLMEVTQSEIANSS